MLIILHKKFQQSKSISFNYNGQRAASLITQLSLMKMSLSSNLPWKILLQTCTKKIQLFRYHKFDDRTASLISQHNFAHFSAQLELNEFISGYVLGSMLIKSGKKFQHFKLISFNCNGERTTSLITQLSLLEMSLLKI